MNSVPVARNISRILISSQDLSILQSKEDIPWKCIGSDVVSLRKAKLLDAVRILLVRDTTFPLILFFLPIIWTIDGIFTMRVRTTQIEKFLWILFRNSLKMKMFHKSKQPLIKDWNNCTYVYKTRKLNGKLRIFKFALSHRAIRKVQINRI